FFTWATRSPYYQSMFGIDRRMIIVLPRGAMPLGELFARRCAAPPSRHPGESQAKAGMTGRKTAGDSERSAAMNHAAIRSQELNPASLATLYRKEFQLCRVAAGETLAAVSDLATRREVVAASFPPADQLGAHTHE